MRKGKMLLLFLLPPFFLTGCWDKKDPEDRAFIMTLGVDDSAKGCSFTFAPANTGGGEAQTYSAESETLAGAVAKIDGQMSRKTDLGQLKTVILSGDFLEDSRKLDSFLQELERSQTVSEKVMLLATEEKAADCVDAVMAADSKTGTFLWDFYKNTAREVAVTKGIDLDTFLTERAEQNGNGVLPRITAKEKKLELGGGIAIARDKVYPLDNEEERGYLFLLGEAEGALLEGEYQGETIPLEIGKSDVKYDFSVEDMDIVCSVTLPMEGTLQGGEGTFLSAEKRAEMETVFEEVIKTEIEHTLKIARRAKTDLFGILPRMYQQEPTLTEGISREALWQSLQFKVQPELELKDMGRKR
ncbi:Ger(x)C family spore germination protein [Anaerotignum sp.]